MMHICIWKYIWGQALQKHHGQREAHFVNNEGIHVDNEGTDSEYYIMYGYSQRNSTRYVNTL